MMAEIFRDEWGADALAQSEVLEETRRIFRKAIDKGTPRQTPHRKAFKERLTASTDVFSAFRVHTQARHMAELLTDENGRRLPFKEWAEKVQPYVNHQNRAWLRTEYDTATRRAHDEADWQRFQEDRDIYPNLEWVRTTSANPGKDHQPFWGTVLPIGDEFWTEHRPGDRWNCKCSLRQTDREPTETPRVSGQEYAPAPGLSAKPGSGEVFSEDHVYYPEDCRICPFAEKAGRLRLLIANLSGKKRRTLATSCMDCPYRKACMDEGKKEKEKKKEIVKERRAEYERLKKDENYTDVEFDEKTGGLKATHKEHNFDTNPMRKDYEPTVQRIGYERGNKVLLEKEDHTKNGIKNVEGTWNNKPFEIAARESATANNIREGLKHCAKKPNCKVAILYFPQNNFSLRVFEEGLSKYNGLKGTKQWAQFDEIICIQRNGTIYKKNH